jgi:HK97 family phage portal protein
VSLVRRRLDRRGVEQRHGSFAGGLDGFVRWAHGGQLAAVSQSSVKSIETALGASVVWRAATKHAATLGAFPVHAYRDGARMLVAPSIVSTPSGDLGELQGSWVAAAVMSMFLRGGINVWLDSDRPTTAVLLHPDRVDWSQRSGWTVDGKPVGAWPVGNLFHVPLFTLPGSPKGLNPLQYAARSVYPGMAAQEFGGNYFRDGVHPTAVASVDGDPGEDGAKALKERIREATSGTSRDIVVLPRSVTWHQLQVSPSDSQFIEAMRLSDEQVARYMMIPPEELGLASSGASLTYANREQRKQDYLQELLFPIRQLESAWSLWCPPGVSVRFNADGLLRTSLKERYESYRIAAEVGDIVGEPLLTVAEMRELENRVPVQGSDS